MTVVRGITNEISEKETYSRAVTRSTSAAMTLLRCSRVEVSLCLFGDFVQILTFVFFRHVD